MYVILGYQFSPNFILFILLYFPLLTYLGMCTSQKVYGVLGLSEQVIDWNSILLMADGTFANTSEKRWCEIYRDFLK